MARAGTLAFFLTQGDFLTLKRPSFRATHSLSTSDSPRGACRCGLLTEAFLAMKSHLASLRTSDDGTDAAAARRSEHAGAL